MVINFVSQRPSTQKQRKIVVHTLSVMDGTVNEKFYHVLTVATLLV